MAHASTEAHGTTFRFGLGGLFRSIMNALDHMAEANSRVRRIEALQALSDAELAQRGIRREDIARHVFSDILYI